MQMNSAGARSGRATIYARCSERCACTDQPISRAASALTNGLCSSARSTTRHKFDDRTRI